MKSLVHFLFYFLRTWIWLVATVSDRLFSVFFVLKFPLRRNWVFTKRYKRRCKNKLSIRKKYLHFLPLLLDIKQHKMRAQVVNFILQTSPRAMKKQDEWEIELAWLTKLIKRIKYLVSSVNRISGCTEPSTFRHF